MDTVAVPAPLVWGLLVPSILALGTLVVVALTNKLAKRDKAECESLRSECRHQLFERLDSLKDSQDEKLDALKDTQSEINVRVVRIETRVGDVLRKVNGGTIPQEGGE